MLVVKEYSWKEIVDITKSAGGRMYVAPYGDYQNDTFRLVKVSFREMKKKRFFTLKKCQKLDLDEDEAVIRRLIKLYKEGANIPPVILNQDLTTIDGSHRLSAMYELEYEDFFAYVRE